MGRHERRLAERRERREARLRRQAEAAARQPRVRTDVRVEESVWLPAVTNMPDDRAAMEKAVWRCAQLILAEIPASLDGWPQLEQMVEVINRQPGRWRVVSKVNHNDATWAFEVVPRLVLANVTGDKP